jgi:hypothetical protein
VLPSDAERLPACDEDRRSRRSGEQLGHVRSCLHHVFERVENEQDGSAGKMFGDGVDRRELGAGDPDGEGDLADDLGRVGRGAELDERRFVAGARLGGLQSQPCLPDPSRPRQRQEPDLGALQRGHDDVELALAPDQARRRQRQRGGRPGRQAQPASRRRLELGPLVPGEGERVGQPEGRVPVDPGSETTLDVADGPGTDIGLLGEFLLRETGRGSVGFQQRRYGAIRHDRNRTGR